MSSKVTKAEMETMRIGGRPKVFRALSVADFQSQVQTAYYVRKNHPRKDGGVYVISSSGVGMTITIKVEKGGDA